MGLNIYLGKSTSSLTGLPLFSETTRVSEEALGLPNPGLSLRPPINVYFDRADSETGQPLNGQSPPLTDRTAHTGPEHGRGPWLTSLSFLPWPIPPQSLVLLQLTFFL